MRNSTKLVNVPYWILLNTENELFESRKAYLAAHYSGIVADYRLLNSTGLLLNELRVAIPDEWARSSK